MKRFCVLLLTTVLLMAASAAQAEESFILDGTSYTLPFALAELLDDGWEINHPEEILSPGSYTLADELRRGSASCQVQIINLSMNDQQKRDCYVGQITFTKDFAEDVILPGGLALSNSWKTVYDQLGTPSDLHTETPESEELLYGGKDFDKLSFTVDTADGSVTSVTLRSFTSPEPVVRKAAPTELPNMDFDYEQPESLGKHLDAFHVRLNGELYQLPMPYRLCAAEGWKPLFDVTHQIASGETLDDLLMQLPEGGNVTIGLCNPTANACTAEDSFVYILEVDSRNCDASFELSGGLSMGMTENELLAALTNVDYLVEEQSDGVVYRLFDDLSRTIAITVDPVPDRVCEIMLLHLPE